MLFKATLSAGPLSGTAIMFPATGLRLAKAKAECLAKAFAAAFGSDVAVDTVTPIRVPGWDAALIRQAKEDAKCGELSIELRHEAAYSRAYYFSRAEVVGFDGLSAEERENCLPF